MELSPRVVLVAVSFLSGFLASILIGGGSIGNSCAGFCEGLGYSESLTSKITYDESNLSLVEGGFYAKLTKSNWQTIDLCSCGHTELHGTVWDVEYERIDNNWAMFWPKGEYE